MWTNGAPLALPIPNGYFWEFQPGHQFLNDSGTAVTKISFSSGLPGGVTNNVLRWRNGVADIAPPPPPSALSPPSCSTSYVHYYPAGLNNGGHVLILATAATGGCPWILWIWDGTGSAPGNFQEIAPTNFGQFPCTPTYIVRFDGQHVNDADHVAVEFGPRDGPSPNCPTPLSAGILAGGTFTPVLELIPDAGTAGIAALNNHDQLVAFFGPNAAPQMKLWDGAAVVDLGAGGGLALNDLGHVVFSAHPGAIPRLYKGGAVTDLPLPPAIPGFFLEPSGAVWTGGINSTGQVLLSMSFHAGGPSGPLVAHPVVLTPAPPTITLKVNGQDPTPPIVTTSGPMLLTLDLSASAYTAPLSWYWGVIVGNQLIWLTSTGLSTTPAPLGVAPPVAITNATLLNITLAPGTTFASFFFMVDGGGSAVAFDAIAATRP